MTGTPESAAVSTCAQRPTPVKRRALRALALLVAWVVPLASGCQTDPRALLGLEEESKKPEALP